VDCLREYPDERSAEHRECMLRVRLLEANRNVHVWKRNALWIGVAALVVGALAGRASR
jgi:hypothetical protein